MKNLVSWMVRMPSCHARSIARRCAILATICLAGFLSTPVAAATTCCGCRTVASPTQNICIQTTLDCGTLIEKTTNRAIKSLSTCATVIDPSQCKPVDKGVCITGPVNEVDYTPPSTPAGQTPENTSVPFGLKLNIPIPGVEFADAVIQQDSYIIAPQLSQYISGIERYMIGIAITAAAVMIVYGGFLYIVASSGASVKTGKSVIVDAVIGLILVLGCVTILGTVNPNLVSPTSLKLNNVKLIQQSLGHSNDGLTPTNPNEDFRKAAGLPPTAGATSPIAEASLPSESTGMSSAGGGCNPKDSMKRFGQAQAPWGSMAFGKKPICVGADYETYKDASGASCCLTYGDAACGPTALAIVLAAYGENVTPGTLGQLAIDKGLRNCNSGGVSPLAVLTAGGYTSYEVDASLMDKNKKKMDALDTALTSGHPVIFLCGGCTVSHKKDGKTVRSHTFGGHFLVLSGVYDDGNYAVRDPSLLDANFIARSEVNSPRVSFLYIRRKDGTPVTSCASSE